MNLVLKDVSKATGRKLSFEQITEIKERYKQTESQVSLSENFGVNQTTISRIVRGKTYRNKPEQDFDCNTILNDQAEQLRTVKSENTVLKVKVAKLEIRVDNLEVNVKNLNGELQAAAEYFKLVEKRRKNGTI